MKTPGKTGKPGQLMKRVSVDADLLPKLGAKKKTKVEEDAAPAKARVNVYSPVTPKVAATRKAVRQTQMNTLAAQLGHAIETGTLPPEAAKKLVLARLASKAGIREAGEEWYRSHHIEQAGGRTPAQLVRAGEIKAVLAYIDEQAAKGQ